LDFLLLEDEEGFFLDGVGAETSAGLAAERRAARRRTDLGDGWRSDGARGTDALKLLILLYCCANNQ